MLRASVREEVKKMTDTTTEPRYAVEIEYGRERVLDVILDADEPYWEGAPTPPWTSEAELEGALLALENHGYMLAGPFSREQYARLRASEQALGIINEAEDIAELDDPERVDAIARDLCRRYLGA
jgi:hypothetical protein